MNININFNGFVALLTIAFIVLKLCGVITWSWWWVVSPILFCFAFVAVIGIFLFCICILSLLLRD